MNVNPAYQNFTSGELSPKLYGRSDILQYRNGCRRIENFLLETQGSANFRAGFQWVAQTKDNKKAFLQRFQFSDEQAYCLEFTEGNIRIYRDRGVLTSGGSPVDVATPYMEADLFSLKFTQDAKELYITHNRYPPKKLTRDAAGTWSLTNHAPTGFSPSFTYSGNLAGVTQANPAVVTYTGADDFVNGDYVYFENVVGMTELNENYYEIANVNTGANTFELVGIDSTSYTAYTSGGDLFNANFFPSAATFYEQRLVYGGSIADPETLWFSKSANFDDFTVGTGATDGIKYTIAAGEGVNKVEWLRGTENFLAVGGFGDLLRVTGGEGQTAISPTSISIKPTNTQGAADINPVTKKQIVLFVQRNQRTVLSLELDPISGAYKPVDRNLFADHITTSGITQVAYQEGRPDVFWAILNNGNLIGLTIALEQEVSGWHRHTTEGDFISVASTPRSIDYDDLWVCVKRNINGSDVYSIEYMNDFVDYPQREDYVLTTNQTNDDAQFERALMEAQKGYIHLDSAGTFDGSTRVVDASASLSVSAVTGTGITLTAGASVFVSGDVGAEVKIKSSDGSKYGAARITAYTSGTIVTADVVTDFSATSFTSSEWYITSNTITGLSHLEGETVGIIVDGCVHDDKTVSSGSVSLDTYGSVVHVGLKYNGTLETMNLDGGTRTGTAQTKKISVAKVGARFLNTLGLEYGTDYYNLEQRLLRRAINLLDNPPPVFTGDDILRFKDGSKSDEGGWSRQKRVIFKQTQALPATIQLITPYFNVSDVD